MHEGIVEAGCDEAGRGCLCGPVCAAAVILPPGFECAELNDSKKLTENMRERLRPIIEREALAWEVVMVSPQEIDRINILRASIEGMHRALARIIDDRGVEIDHILVDGNKFRPFRDIGFTTVVKGDGKYMSIAAASVLAKTHRDELMRRLSEEYPGYGWERNMGYPTKEHKEAILRLGLTPHHRMSYAPCQPTLFDNFPATR